MFMEISGLDIGEVVIAGLIKLGRLPEPNPNRIDKYKVIVTDGRYRDTFISDEVPQARIMVMTPHNPDH